jgi:hypothetical protein
VPAEYRRYAVEHETGHIGVDWTVPARQNIHNAFSEYIKYDRSEMRIVANIERADNNVRRIMAFASEDELRAIAAPQTQAAAKALNGSQPYGLLESNYGYIQGVDENGKPRWHNIFWYH